MKRLLSMSLLLSTTVVATTGCETETATTAVVADRYPVIADGGDPSTQLTVYKVWWVTTLFVDPVVPGAESALQRTVPAADYAYALLAPGWDPTSTTPPVILIPVRSADKLGVTRGETLRIEVSDATFVGNCAGGKTLSQDDADFITLRIFPGDFATVTYDAKNCTSTALPSDGGTDGATGDGAAGDGGIGDAGVPDAAGSG
jgi:hypothetical protein